MIGFSLKNLFSFRNHSQQRRGGVERKKASAGSRLRCEQLEGRVVPVTFTGTGTNPASGLALAASATFTQSGTNLNIYLANTATAGAKVPTDVLTGVYFDLAGCSTLTRGNATLHAGSTVVSPPAGFPSGTNAGSGNVGGEIAFKGSSSALSGITQKCGVSSSGMGIFGSAELLNVDDPTNAINLQGPVVPDGVQYGQVGVNGLDPVHNSALDTNATIKNGVDIVLHNFTGTLTDASITNVRFQYGTALTEPSITGNPPEPPPTITVAKTASPTSLSEGGVGSQSVTYTFTVTNTSSATDPVTIQTLNDSVLGPLTGSASCQVGTVLAPGASCSFTQTTTLAAQNAGTSHSNTFTATGKDDENTPTNTATATATVNFTDVLPSLAVTKSVNPTTISEGGVGNQTVTYTFTVTNTSAASTDPVTIQSLSDSQLGALAGSGTCMVGTVLAPGGSCSFTQTVTLGVQNAGYVHGNTFTATGKDDENNSTSASASASVTYTDVLPSLAVTKSVNPTTISEGGVGNQTVTYTFTVTNTSAASTDPVTIQSLSDSQLGALAGSGSCMVGTVLAPGGSCSFTQTVTLGVQNAGYVHGNTFTATGKDDENNSTSASASASVTYTDVLPSLAVAKSVNPTTISEGGVGNQTVTYTYTVTNTSAASTDPVTIQSLADNQLGSLTGSATCQVGTVLAKGASCSFTVTTTLATQNAGFVLGNTFTATGKDDENNSTSASASASVTYTDVLPSLAVTKSVNPTTISEGGVGNQTVTYTFTVTNTSAASTDPVTIQSLSDSQLGALAGSGTCMVGTTLAPGASCSFTQTVTLGVRNAGYVHGNTFTATGKDDENNSTSASASASVTYTDVLPSLAVTKSVSPKMVQENGLGNQSVTYTFTVTNTSVASTDPVTIQSLSDNVLGALAGSGTCGVGTILAPGGSCSFTLTTTVPSQAAGTTLTNTFTATGKDDENNSTSASATATVYYVGASITLSPAGTAVNPIDPGNGSSAHTFTANVTTTVPAGSGITVSNGNITITASNGQTVTCNAATTCSLTVNSTVFTTITATATVNGISFSLGAETLSGVSRTSNTATKVFVDGRICGIKYRDLNTNGFYNPEINEPTLAGWTIYIDSNNNNIFDAGERSTVTDANGKYCFFELPVGTYQVREVQQAGWITTTGDPIPATITFNSSTRKMDTWAALAGQTNPTIYHNEQILLDSTMAMPSPELAIGNIPQLINGPRTLGFWGNKNGRAILANIGVLAWTDTLLRMHLRNADGSDWDINYSGGLLSGNTALCTDNLSCHNLLRTWLLSGNATNMAYMLSVQLATMRLNTMGGGVALSAQVYVTNAACTAGGRSCSSYTATVSSDAADGMVDGKATIGNLINEADAALAMYGTVSSSTNSAQLAYFETLKNIFDDGNNGRNFV